MHHNDDPPGWAELRNEVATQGELLEGAARRDNLNGMSRRNAATHAALQLAILRELVKIRIRLEHAAEENTKTQAMAKAFMGDALGHVEACASQLATLNTYTAQILDHLQGVEGS
jgi:hypothetical protein